MSIISKPPSTIFKPPLPLPTSSPKSSLPSLSLPTSSPKSSLPSLPLPTPSPLPKPSLPLPTPSPLSKPALPLPTPSPLPKPTLPKPSLPLPTPSPLPKPSLPLPPQRKPKRLPPPPGMQYADEGTPLEAPPLINVPEIKNETSFLMVLPKRTQLTFKPINPNLPLPPKIEKIPIPKNKKVGIFYEDNLIEIIVINKWTSLKHILLTAKEKVMNHLKDDKEFLKLTVELEDIMDNSQLLNPKNNKTKIFNKLSNNPEDVTKLVYTKKGFNTQCISSDALRKAGYKNLEEWMDNPNNVFVGKFGRIKTEDENGKTHLTKVKWGNPYQYDPISKEEEIRLYNLYLFENDLLKDIPELLGKTLGCYCDQNNEECHAKILYKLTLNL